MLKEVNGSIYTMNAFFILFNACVFFLLCAPAFGLSLFFFFLLSRNISRFADQTLPQFDNLDPGRLSHVFSMTSKGAMLENLIYDNSKEMVTTFIAYVNFS